MENYSFGKLTRNLDERRTNNSRMSNAEVFNARENNSRNSDAELFNAGTNNSRMSNAEVFNARENNSRISDAEVFDTRRNNANADGGKALRENFLRAQGEQKRVPVGDRIFLQSVIKRQKLVIQDLCHLNEFYPNVIDKDIIGGLFSLFCLLDDGAQSSEFSNRH